MVCGCTLIIGDRRSNPTAPEDMMLGGLDGGGGDGGQAVCTFDNTDKLVNGGNQIDALEAADVAPIGNGQFIVTFTQASQLWETEVDTGRLDDPAPIVTMMNGPRTVLPCNNCRDARVSAASSFDNNVWFSVISDNTTLLAQVARASWTASSTFMSDCGGANLAQDVSAVGNEAIALTACGSGTRMIGSSIADAPFNMANMPLEMRVRPLVSQAVHIAGWTNQANGGVWTATAAMVDPKTGTPRNIVDVANESRGIGGLAFDVLDGTPAQLLVAYGLGAAPSEVWVYSATFNNQPIAKVNLGNAVSIAPHMPLGVAAGKGFFLVSYTAPGSPLPQAVLQRVGPMGDAQGQPLVLSAPGVPGFAPRVVYSADGDRFGAVWVGPTSAGSSERLVHFKVVKCH
jgi:hypothetical protein